MIYNYKSKIQSTMGWSDTEFDLFFLHFERVLASQNPTQVTKQIYNSRYLDTILSLFFFVYIHRVSNKKSFLIALLLNGLYDDRYNLYPNTKQTEFNKTFFSNDLSDLIDKNTLEHFQFLCDKQSFTDNDMNALYFDYLLFHDFRLVFKAISISEKSFIFYHLNPNEILYPKSISLDDPLILEGLNDIYDQISNLNMKDLYKNKIEAYKDFALT